MGAKPCDRVIGPSLIKAYDKPSMGLAPRWDSTKPIKPNSGCTRPGEYVWNRKRDALGPRRTQLTVIIT